MAHVSVGSRKRIMWFERGRPNTVNYASQITAAPTWQKHHILPCTSVKGSIAEVKKQSGKEHVETALKYFTNWNINKKPNLIALPTRTTYNKAYGKKGGKQGVVSPACSNLPSHQPTNWGHTIYNERVDKSLRKVWAKVVIKIDGHKIESKDIGSDITAKENQWRKKVIGARQATLDNWKKFMKGETPAKKPWNHFTLVPFPKSPI